MEYVAIFIPFAIAFFLFLFRIIVLTLSNESLSNARIDHFLAFFLIGMMGLTFVFVSKTGYAEENPTEISHKKGKKKPKKPYVYINDKKKPYIKGKPLRAKKSKKKPFVKKPACIKKEKFINDKKKAHIKGKHKCLKR